MSSRKIWSVPIAVLALALMLIGGMVASSIVQAQTIDRNTFYMIAGNTGATFAVEVKGLDRSDATNGRSAAISTADDAVALSGTGFGHFEAADVGTPTGTTNNESQNVNITIDTGDAPAAGVYNLTLSVDIDLDDTDDADNDGTATNDDDRTVTSSVTIYVIGPPTAAVQFHADTSTALEGARVSGFGSDVRNAPKSIQVAGMAPNSKILVAPAAAGADADSGRLSRQNGLDFFVDPNDGTKIIALFTGNPAPTEADTTFAIDIDTDATKDVADDDDDPTSEPTRGDGDKDNDPELTITIAATLDLVTSLGWGDSEDSPDAGDIGPPFEFTMLSNEPSGSAIGNVYIDGADLDTDEDGTAASPTAPDEGGEFLDGILLDSDGNAQTMFTVRGVNATVDDNQPLQLVYNGGGLTLGTHMYRLSVNGDSGIAHRTISDGGTDDPLDPNDDPLINVSITVNPVNEGPTGPDSHSARATETVEGAGILDSGDDVADMSGLASDTNLLVYSLVQGDDASQFTIDSSTGVVTVGSAPIADNVVATAAVVDNPSTTDVNEAKAAVYGRPSGDGGELVDTSSLYSDITYEFTVNVSDGNASSSHNIAVTLTVDVNEPVTEMGDIGGDAPTYKTTDVQNHEIVDLNDYLSGSDSPDDDVQYIWEITPVNPPFGIYEGSIRVNYPGPSRPIADDPLTTDVDETWDPEDDGWTIRILVGDAFANGSGPEACENETSGDAEVCTDPTNLPNGVDAVLDFTIKQIPGPPLQSHDLTFTVNENAEAGTSVGTIEIDGATTYSIISGTGGARDDFDVDTTTGEITVINPRDYDAEGAENNIVLLVDAFGENGIRLGAVIAGIEILDINEAPIITAIPAGDVPWVYENFQIGDAVVTKISTQPSPDAENDPDTMVDAMDPEGLGLTYTVTNASDVPFTVASDGTLRVSGTLEADDAAAGTHKTHDVMISVSDPAGNATPVTVTVTILNSNESPVFTSPLGDDAVDTFPEDIASSEVLFNFTATDEDGDDLTFALRQGQSQDLFEIRGAGSTMVDGVEVWSGNLHAKAGALDYEDEAYDARVHVEVNDPEGLNDTLLLTVNLSNVNDNDPVFDGNPSASVSVVENTSRGHVLGNYSATDADGDIVNYSLSGANAKSFDIGDTGDLITLESLDYDNAGTPCGTGHQCVVNVVAKDGDASDSRSVSFEVTITITAAEDSVSTLDVSKANPVPGTEMGVPMSALSNAKQSINKGIVPEAPGDIPASYGDAPRNFVETEWANWGTVLRIAITSESPDPNCGNGNQCVFVDVNSDSADDSLKLQAYRSAEQENQFLAALMLVELSSHATPGDAAVYKHTDGGVAALKVDEEDEVEIEYGNLRDTVDVENEAPEVSNFAPEHERAFDDADVDYTFTVTDSNSGLPEPEDLPDTDGDENYTPVVALISKSEGGVGQCSVTDTGAAPKDSDAVLSVAAHIHEDDVLYCPGTAQDGEYVAAEGGFGFAPIRDDKDFDEIDDGYDVETTIVLTENDTYYVTFIVCDNAGNCAYHDPDGNDDDEELAEITVDTEDPVFVEARTGLKWDSTDNEYDDDRSYIQVIFNDLTTLNAATVEADDFVVEGHTIVGVQVYENPDSDDVDWADSGRYADEGSKNLRHIDRYRDLENAVFIELADELLADETPDVTIVPNGVEDGAGNEQDDGDHEADDWISPKFTIVSITSTLETAQDQTLAGDGDEITVVVTSDERLDATRPTVTVTYVNAPAGTVDTKGTMSCKVDKDENSTRDRGEIVLTDYCQDSSAAAGGTLNNSVEKISNTEWIVTVTEPDDTGYYSFRIQGVDRSPQENPGSEGISADSIVTDFFDSDGDVNSDDAVFWEADINLAKPNVRVSGNVITDNEPDIEYRSPLFVEIDFTRNHTGSADCGDDEDNDHLMANCVNENSEYAEDNFDDIVITMFELDGVDMTDSVKTTDDQTFLVTLENVALGDHTAKIQATDVAGNSLEDVLEIDFEVSDRDPFERRLNPGWNLVSLPGEPSDSAIGSVFGPGVEVRTVYTYDPVVPGGWMVAVRETLDSEWQGDLTEITGSRGYWVLSDAIQDWEVSIPRLAGGAAGTGTPIQPPVIPLYAGWNLIPVTDISGNGEGGDDISATVYLQNLDDGLDLARVLGFDTIRNQWFTVLDMQMGSPGDLQLGSGYWVFVREAASLVPSGIASGSGGGD